MGRIVISENVTLDGVVRDPTGEEGSRHGGWFNRIEDHDREEWGKVAFAEALGGAALLVGRHSDEYFGSRWNVRTGPFADRLNGLPKYVVSTTLAQPVWVNSTVLAGDVATEVRRLKQAVDGEIIVIGSIRLARSLLEFGLVDELRLTVYPFVLGAGDRLFGDTTDKTSIRPTSVDRVGNSLVHLTYEVLR